MYEENTAEKDWTMKLLKEVMHLFGGHFRIFRNINYGDINSKER